MAILLAGLRGIDEEIWKAAKIDGIPTWRTYLFIVAADDAGRCATALILQIVGVVRVFDLVVAMTQGGPGISTQMPAIYVIQHITDRANVGQGMAAATMMLLPVDRRCIAPAGFLQWRASAVKESGMMTSRRAAMTAAGTARIDAGPRGPRPKRLTLGRVGIYAFLIIAALFFLHAALGDDHDVAEVDAGDPLRQHLHTARASSTFDPWVKAWDTACTGRDCNGLKPGLLELGEDHRCSVPRLDHRRRAQRLCAGFWQLQGLRAACSPSCVFGAFVPYQVLIYPLIIGLRRSRPVRHAAGHRHRPHHLRHADPDAAVPQLLRLAAAGAVQGGARRRGRVLAHLLPDHAADVACRSPSWR